MTRYRVQWLRPHSSGSSDPPQVYRRADFDSEADAARFEAHLRARGRIGKAGGEVLVCVYPVTVEVAA